MPVDQEIILKADGLRADERAVAEVLRALDADTEVLVAVGAGTLHDIVRHCAMKRGIPFVSCPTAASSGGFAAASCRMILEGRPVTLPAAAPVLVLADVDVMRRAPRRLASSGAAEMLSKAIALADACVAEQVAGETACPKAEAMIRQAVTLAQGAADRLDGADGIAQLIYAEVLYGLSTQMDADLTQVTAVEQMAALMDLLPNAYGAKDTVLYGEIAGAWAVALSGLYHRVAEMDDVESAMLPFRPLDTAFLTKHFGALAQALAEENERDCLARIHAEMLIRQWPEVRRAAAETPAKDELVALLTKAGAPATPEAIGVSGASVPQMLQLAPCLTNRVTLLRLLRLLRFRYSSAEASRAPSRSSRYADKAIMRAGKSSAVSASSMR